ncbi:MAG: tetratricopeptide repeat protein [Prevotella sp.]|nr:tetratricopeptide repeat protein [Prevotella sp.]MBO4658643.1 tetratricopeptide repeat protein [Prevotella sp.]
MDLRQLIEHPELMNKETLYDLRSLIALHPYYQTARLLMLKNLYLLHDSSFDDELRRAAIYITDRTKLFDLVEAGHYQLKPRRHHRQQAPASPSDRTLTLIDNFLNTVPDDNTPSTRKRKPTAADATVDYVAYLLREEGDHQQEEHPEMRGQGLIDKFINDEGGKITLKEEPEYVPQAEETEKNAEEGYFTETLARIYVKQGRYSKALEIIKRLNLNYPKKSAYFADQIRFLEKLITNNNKK